MTTPTTTNASDRMTSRISGLSDRMLVAVLRDTDRALTKSAPDDRRALALTRARLIEEAEQRWPAASDAVSAAFEAHDAALQRGEDAADPDYVAVLLAHIPGRLAR